MSRSRARRAVIAVTAAGLLALMVAPALAHVTVHSHDAAQGGYAKLTFRVPTERDNASTVKLTVHFPKNAPIAGVSVKPHPGWSFKTTTSKPAKPIKTHDGKVTQVVSAITWTADSPATAIKPGEFDEFSVSAGPLPHVSTMTFPAIQTYSNGEVVRWIETAAPGAAEPEHPAPTLDLAPANASSSKASADPSTGPSVTAAAQNAPPSTSSTTSLAIAIAALVVAVLAAAVGLIAFRRRGAAR